MKNIQCQLYDWEKISHFNGILDYEYSMKIFSKPNFSAKNRRDTHTYFTIKVNVLFPFPRGFSIKSHNCTNNKNWFSFANKTYKYLRSCFPRFYSNFILKKIIKENILWLSFYFNILCEKIFAVSKKVLKWVTWVGKQ